MNGWMNERKKEKKRNKEKETKKENKRKKERKKEIEVINKIKYLILISIVFNIDTVPIPIGPNLKEKRREKCACQ